MTDVTSDITKPHPPSPGGENKMNKEQFKAILDKKGYAYETAGRAIIVTHQSFVYLSGLTTLPEGTQFNNRGYVYLGDLTTLPKGIQFNNRGSIHLRGLTDGKYAYRGKTIRLRNVDGYTMLVNSERKSGDYAILSCRYFGGGDLSKLLKCFVATDGEHDAHGGTIESAIRDLRFKIAQVDFDADDLLATIRARGTVTFNDFRLLTGACEEGLRHGLKVAGVSPDTEEMTIAEAVKAAHGPYGDKFKEMVGA